MKLILIVEFKKAKVIISKTLELAVKVIEPSTLEFSHNEINEAFFIANDNQPTNKNTLKLLIILAVTLVISYALPAQARGKELGATVTKTPKRISDIVCYQSGQKVIEENNLLNLMFGNGMIHGERADGKQVTVLNVEGNADTVCKLIEVLKDNIQR